MIKINLLRIWSEERLNRQKNKGYSSANEFPFLSLSLYNRLLINDVSRYDSRGHLETLLFLHFYDALAQIILFKIT